MTTREAARRERLLELLSLKAVEGLSRSGNEELRQLLAQDSELDLTTLDLAAASVHLAHIDWPAAAPASSDDLPVGVAAKIEREAELFFAGRARRQEANTSGGKTTSPQVLELVAEPHPASPPRVGQFPLAWLAAAACLLLGIGVWSSRGDVDPASVPAAQAESPARQRAELMARPDVVRCSLRSLDAASSAHGDVVWDRNRQRGVLQVGALPPAHAGMDYQLWIIDAEQDEATPIDAGVFDIDPEQPTALVAVSTRLHASHPRAFLVTEERTGGVVVSKRERVVLSGDVPGSER